MTSEWYHDTWRICNTTLKTHWAWSWPVCRELIIPVLITLTQSAVYSHYSPLPYLCPHYQDTLSSVYSPLFVPSKMFAIAKSFHFHLQWRRGKVSSSFNLNLNWKNRNPLIVVILSQAQLAPLSWLPLSLCWRKSFIYFLLKTSHLLVITLQGKFISINSFW